MIKEAKHILERAAVAYINDHSETGYHAIASVTKNKGYADDVVYPGLHTAFEALDYAMQALPEEIKRDGSRPVPFRRDILFCAMPGATRDRLQRSDYDWPRRAVCRAFAMAIAGMDDQRVLSPAPEESLFDQVWWELEIEINGWDLRPELIGQDADFAISPTAASLRAYRQNLAAAGANAPAVRAALDMSLGNLPGALSDPVTLPVCDQESAARMARMAMDYIAHEIEIVERDVHNDPLHSGLQSCWLIAKHAVLCGSVATRDIHAGEWHDLLATVRDHALIHYGHRQSGDDWSMIPGREYALGRPSFRDCLADTSIGNERIASIWRERSADGDVDAADADRITRRIAEPFLRLVRGYEESGFSTAETERARRIITAASGQLFGALGDPENVASCRSQMQSAAFRLLEVDGANPTELPTPSHLAL